MILDSKTDLKALTGIRAFAAIWVVLHHFEQRWTLLFPEWMYLKPITSLGGHGVDLFFILSGFILAHTYWDKCHYMGLSDYARFIWCRVCRVYPAYLFVLALFIVTISGLDVLNKAYPKIQFPWNEIGWHILMVQSWGGVTPTRWNYPAWSVSAEWFAYLILFPLLGWIPITKLKGYLGFIVGWIIVLLGGWMISLSIPGFEKCALLGIACFFPAGYILYHIRKEQPHMPGAAMSWLGILFVVIAICVDDIYNVEKKLLLASGFYFIIGGLSVQGHILERMLSHKSLVYAGKVSYSLYIIHAFIEIVIKAVLPADKFANSELWIRLLVFMGHVGLLVVGAVACYHLIEEPARRWLRGKCVAG